MANTVVNFVWNSTCTLVIQTIFLVCVEVTLLTSSLAGVIHPEQSRLDFGCYITHTWDIINVHLVWLQESRGGGCKVDYNGLWFVAIEISTPVKCWTHGSLRGQQKLKNSLDKYVPVVTLYNMECVCPLLSPSGWFCVRACQNWNGEWS